MRRVNYKNITKGLRRLDKLLAGDLDKTRDLIHALPAALDVPPEVVEHAIEDTRHQIAAAQEAARHAREAAWRAAFRPHAIILTEQTVPQPIFAVAIIGAERLLRIDFDSGLGPGSYTNQALAGVRRKLAEFSSESGKIADTLPAFGRPVGVIVNYTPDRAVRFDLDGKPLVIFPRAHRTADAYIMLCGRPMRPASNYASQTAMTAVHRETYPRRTRKGATIHERHFHPVLSTAVPTIADAPQTSWVFPLRV
jgi:hypothetical protein